MDTYGYFYVTALELATSQNHNKTKQNRIFVGHLVLVLNLSNTRNISTNFMEDPGDITYSLFNGRRKHVNSLYSGYVCGYGYPWISMDMDIHGYPQKICGYGYIDVKFHIHGNPDDLCPWRNGCFGHMLHQEQVLCLIEELGFY